MPSKTEYQSSRSLLNIINELDIVEFNRYAYSHYALYVGDGICVHVTDDRNRSKGYKCAEKLIDIANDDLVRVNNSEMTANSLKVRSRSRDEALGYAYSGLPTDDYGNLILGVRTPVHYSVTSADNCEGYATHWKYDHESGWSTQVNGMVGHLSATTHRVCSKGASECKKVIDDDDAEPLEKCAAAVAFAVYKVVGNVNEFGTKMAEGLSATILGFLED